MIALGTRWSWPAVLALLTLGVGAASGWVLLLRISMVLLGLLALSLLVTVLNALALRAEGHPTAHRAVAGDRVTVRYTIHNRAPWPLPWILLEPHGLSYLPVQGQLVGVGPFGRRQIDVSLPCPQRGHWQAGGWALRTGDPFGFFERVRHGRGADTIVVYPRPLPLPGLGLPRPAGGGTARRGAPSPQPAATVREVRPYRPGDLPSRIHWLSTARLDTLMVKESEPEPAAHAWLILDLDEAVQYGEDAGDSAELIVGAASALVSRLLHAHLATGLLVAGPDIVAYPDERRSQAEHLRELLAAVIPAPASVQDSLALLARRSRPTRGPITPLAWQQHLAAPWPAAAWGARGGIVVVLTPWADSRWSAALPVLARAGYSVVCALLDTPESGLEAVLADQAATLRAAGISVYRHTSWAG